MTQRPSNSVEGDLELRHLQWMADRTRLIAVEMFDGERLALWSPT